MTKKTNQEEDEEEEDEEEKKKREKEKEEKEEKEKEAKIRLAYQAPYVGVSNNQELISLLFRLADSTERTDGGGSVREMQRKKEKAFNLSKLTTGSIELKSIVEFNSNLVSVVENRVLTKFRNWLKPENFLKGKKGLGRVALEAGPLWSVRGIGDERLVIYQIESTFYGLMHFPTKTRIDPVTKKEDEQFYNDTVARMIAVFLFYQYKI